MSDDKQTSKWAARACQRVFRHQVAKALYTEEGDPAIRAALESLGAAMQLQAIEGPRGSRSMARVSLDAPPLAALASLLRGEFAPDDLVLPESLLSELAGELVGLEDGREKPAQDKPAPGQPGRRDGDRDGDRRDEKVIDYELWLLVTKIDCERETPGLGADRMLLEGRAKYRVPPPASDVDRPLDNGYEGTHTEEGKPDTQTYKLFEVRVGQGLAYFDAFINPLESDGMSRAAARAIGYAVGGLLTGGVNAAYAALVASAPSAGLTAADAAKDLIADFTLPWLVGLIARWFGPEQFTQINIEATTNRTGAIVSWGGTVSSGSFTRTLSAVGPGTLTYAGVQIQQQEASEDQDGNYVLRLLRDGGLYTVDIALQLVAV
jgi:hypothetical protein